MRIVKTDKQGRISLKRAIKSLAPYYKMESSSDGNIWLFPIRESEFEELGIDEEEGE